MNTENQNARPGEPEAGSSGEHGTNSAPAHPLQAGNGFATKITGGQGEKPAMTYREWLRIFAAQREDRKAHGPN